MPTTPCVIFMAPGELGNGVGSINLVSLPSFQTPFPGFVPGLNAGRDAVITYSGSCQLRC